MKWKKNSDSCPAGRGPIAEHAGSPAKIFPKLDMPEGLDPPVPQPLRAAPTIASSLRRHAFSPPIFKTRGSVAPVSSAGQFPIAVSCGLHRVPWGWPRWPAHKTGRILFPWGAIFKAVAENRAKPSQSSILPGIPGRRNRLRGFCRTAEGRGAWRGPPSSMRCGKLTARIRQADRFSYPGPAPANSSAKFGWRSCGSNDPAVGCQPPLRGTTSYIRLNLAEVGGLSLAARHAIPSELLSPAPPPRQTAMHGRHAPHRIRGARALGERHLVGRLRPDGLSQIQGFGWRVSAGRWIPYLPSGAAPLRWESKRANGKRFARNTTPCSCSQPLGWWVGGGGCCLGARLYSAEVHRRLRQFLRASRPACDHAALAPFVD